MASTTFSKRRRLDGSAILFVLLLSIAIPAFGQKFELSPLVGARFGGTIELKPDSSATGAKASFQDGAVFGVAAGVRFDSFDACEGCDLIEFRWMRQNTHLNLNDTLFVTPLAGSSNQPGISVDHFLGDFTHEFPLNNSKYVRPYMTGTLGAARMAAPGGSATRFVFGIGAGLKISPNPHFGLRIGVEYLPMVMQGEVQKIVCSGGCIVALTGGLTNQFQVTVGPVFHF